MLWDSPWLIYPVRNSKVNVLTLPQSTKTDELDLPSILRQDGLARERGDSAVR